MKKKVLFLDACAFNSSVQVGSHKYAKLFRKNNYEVFCLSNFLNINRFIRKNSEDKELINNYLKGVQTTKEGISFYTPFCILPYIKMPVFDSIKLALTCLNYCFPGLKRILKKRDFIDIDILFINNIRLLSVLRFVKPGIIIIRISDRIDGFNNQPGTILLLQEEALRLSNIAFVTSIKLQEEVRKINTNTVYLQNGVDEDFIKRKDVVYPCPEEYKNIKKPIVLYIGAVSDWFDYEMYEYGMKQLKDVSFVIVGPVSGTKYRENLSRIEKYTKTYQHFHYLGVKAHIDLKNYLAYADIGVIPFEISALTNEINPIKFFEYTAYGLPVVASNMTELQNYKEHAALYKDKEEYVNMISALLNKKEELKNRLIEFARSNTWEKRFDEILAAVKKEANN